MWNIMKLIGAILSSRWLNNASFRDEMTKTPDILKALTDIRLELTAINAKMDKQSESHEFSWVYSLGFSAMALAAGISGVVFNGISVTLIFLLGAGLLTFAFYQNAKKR